MSRFFAQITHSHPRWRPIYLVALVALVGVGVIAFLTLLRGNAPAQAQGGGGTFNSGSDCSEGSLTLTTPGTIIFNPADYGLDPDRDGIINFQDITIGVGVTVVLSSTYINKPVYWLACGAVQINGVVDLSGEDGHPGTAIVSNRRPSVPGSGGYSGGIGFAPTYSFIAQPGNGPGGGSTGGNDYEGGHAGHATSGSSSAGSGFPYGNPFLVPLIGGSGGGGGGIDYVPSEYISGGGAGGGALLVASSVSITVNGTIKANGGQYAPFSSYNRGGSGSGGAIHLLSPAISGGGSLNAYGGPSASAGRIRLEAFQQLFTGTTNPTPVFGTPVQVALPANPPSIRVVSIAGQPVPNVPLGDSGSPDVIISAGSAITVTVEAHNVPLGTTVQLHIISENGIDQIIDSTPLAGEFLTSTASINATMPYGPSRMFVRSDFDSLFLTQQRYTVGNNPSSVKTADLDVDGDLDLVVVVPEYLNYRVASLLGNGDGTFQGPQFFPVDNNPFEVAIGLFNNDMYPDLAVTNHNSNSISVLIGNGDGTFQSHVTYGTGAGPLDIIAEDLNGDNKIDLAVANYGPNNVGVLLGIGDGTFQSQITFTVNGDAGGLAAGDLNEDGDLDLIATNYNTDDISVLLGNGDGTFQPQQIYSMGDGPVSVAVDDVNGDGHLDIATANNISGPSGSISVRLGYGNGTFQNLQSYTADRSPNYVEIADLNDDGLPDIAVANTGSDNFMVFLGNGDGTFRFQQRYSAGQSPSNGTVADVNGDGQPDVIVANGGSDDVSVLLHK